MMWEVLNTGKQPAEKNMAKDRELLLNVLHAKKPSLHFYEWEEPSITYGYFVDPSRYLSLPHAEEMGLKLAKRPTGGGIVFHVDDFSFSIVVPSWFPGYSRSTLDNYALIHRLLAKALRKFLNLSDFLVLCKGEQERTHPMQDKFCMAQPVCYDVMWKGIKIAGGAERRTRHGFLHQGTISFRGVDKQILDKIVLERSLLDCFQSAGMAPGFSHQERETLKRLIIEAFEEFAATMSPS